MFAETMIEQDCVHATKGSTTITCCVYHELADAYHELAVLLV